MDSFTIMEIVKLLAPFIVLELLLKIFCLYRLSKDEVKYFPKFAWALIIIFAATIGSVAYLMAGRKKY